MINLITGATLLIGAISAQINAGVATSSDIVNTASTINSINQIANVVMIEETNQVHGPEENEEMMIERRDSMNYNAKKFESIVREKFANEPLLIKIAKCESSFLHYYPNGEIVRGRVNPADVGIMQINEKYHLETSKSLGFDIYTVEGNLDYAKYMYDREGASPWTASAKCWSKVN